MLTTQIFISEEQVKCQKDPLYMYIAYIWLCQQVCVLDVMDSESIINHGKRSCGAVFTNSILQYSTLQNSILCITIKTYTILIKCTLYSLISVVYLIVHNLCNINYTTLHKKTYLYARHSPTDNNNNTTRIWNSLVEGTVTGTQGDAAACCRRSR
jgi:hypothetical protein